MYAILDNDQKSQLLVLRKFTKSCYNAGNMYVFNSFVVVSFGKTYNFHLASIDIIGFIKYIYFEQIPGMLYYHRMETFLAHQLPDIEILEIIKTLSSPAHDLSSEFATKCICLINNDFVH